MLSYHKEFIVHPAPLPGSPPLFIPEPLSTVISLPHCKQSTMSFKASSSSLLQEWEGEGEVLVVSQSVVATEGLGWVPRG